MKVAIFGMGTVGSGVYRVIQAYQQRTRALGQPTAMEVTHVFANTIRDQDLDLTGVRITNDLEEIFASQPDVIVEVLGGIDFAYEIQQRAIKAGIHVVTANKDMLALHMDDLMTLANQNGVQVHYEAACCGGIPIVGPLQYDLAANQITELKGILNGTSNFILTMMSQAGLTYQEALEQAQVMGYAEKDPTNDVKGLDACRKIAILSRLVYQGGVDFQQVQTRGIDEVEGLDIDLGKEADLTLKLISWSRLEDKGVAIGVEPMFLPNSHLLSHVHKEKNAIYVQGDAIGQSLFYGPGAGSLETGSAIVSDLIDLEKVGYRGNLETKRQLTVLSAQHPRSYYLRLGGEGHQLETYCQAQGISYQVIETQGHQVVMTAPIKANQFSQLQEALDLAAWYPIEEV